jgi:hypothetical protein
VESRLSKHLKRQTRLIARLDASRADQFEVHRVVKARDECSPISESFHERTERRKWHKHSHVRELIRTTNAMQNDYQPMRRCSVKTHTITCFICCLHNGGECRPCSIRSNQSPDEAISK